MNASGTASLPNVDAGYFNDYVLVNGLDTPVALSFADDGETLFVGTRAGVIWHVNLTTGNKVIFYDMTPLVAYSGDRGLMDLRTFPNFATVKQLLVMYVVKNPIGGPDPNQDTASEQRLTRLQVLEGGVRDPNFSVDLFGGNANPIYNGPPVCCNTHAVGSIQFGWDGSLFVSTGEGAHWNFAMGDWGQNALFQGSLDPECRQNFGASEDIGAWRAQYINSLGGKLLRITPDTGYGICQGTTTGAGYPIKNPYCNVI